MTVIIEAARMMAITPAGETRFSTEFPMLNCVYVSGSVSLPTAQASFGFPIARTDIYTLDAVPAACQIVLGGIKLVPSSPSEFYQNSDNWTSYTGEMPYCIWSSYQNYSPTGGASNQGTAIDFVELTSTCSLLFAVESGNLKLYDKLQIYSPRNFGVPQQRTRYAATLYYRLYCGFFI